MQTDPTLYILGAALVSAAISFFTACLMCSRRIRRAEIEGWKQGVQFYQQRQTREPRL